MNRPLFHNCVENRPRRPLLVLILLAICPLAVCRASDDGPRGQGNAFSGDPKGSTPAQTPPTPDTEKEPAVEGQVFDHRGAGIADVEISLARADNESKTIATTRTNRYGDFAIRHDPPLQGSFVVIFRKQGHAETHRDIEIVPGQPPPFVELRLPGSLTLRGTVTTLDGDKPIDKADVRLDSAGRQWNATTAPDGTFTLEKIPPGTGTITVDAGGFARRKQTIEDLKTTAPLDVKLGPERICKIIVGDWRGDPIEGAELNAYDDYLQDRWFSQSDKEGLIILRGLPRESTLLHVQLTHPDYVSDVEPTRELALPENTRESEHRLALLTAGKVEGTVRDQETQQPLQGVRVTVGTSMNPFLPRTWAGFDGRFTIPGVPPGPTIVTTYLRGYALEMKSIRVQPNETTTVDFTLHPTQEAAGVVVNADGKPIAAAYLFATSWRGHQTLGVQAMTDENGRFTMGTIPADEFAVTIQATGYDILEDQIITPGKMDHRFEMKPRTEPPAPADALKVGQPFPELELTTTDGRHIKTADLRGKLVLIDFWATWCGPCVAEIPHLVKLHQSLVKRDDFLMINISADDDRDAAKVRKFVKKHKMTWPQVFGKNSGAQKASDACGVRFLPTKFLVAPDGTIKATNLTAPTLQETIKKFLPKSPNDPQ